MSSAAREQRSRARVHLSVRATCWSWVRATQKWSCELRRMLMAFGSRPVVADICSRSTLGDRRAHLGVRGAAWCDSVLLLLLLLRRLFSCTTAFAAGCVFASVRVSVCLRPMSFRGGARGGGRGGFSRGGGDRGGRGGGGRGGGGYGARSYTPEGPPDRVIGQPTPAHSAPTQQHTHTHATQPSSSRIHHHPHSPLLLR